MCGVSVVIVRVGVPEQLEVVLGHRELVSALKRLEKLPVVFHSPGVPPLPRGFCAAKELSAQRHTGGGWAGRLEAVLCSSLPLGEVCRVGSRGLCACPGARGGGLQAGRRGGRLVLAARPLAWFRGSRQPRWSARPRHPAPRDQPSPPMLAATRAHGAAATPAR
jgi:hypothetical protein